MKTYNYTNKKDLETILQRPELNADDLDALVKEVFENVQSQGDLALSNYVQKFDGAVLEDFQVSEEEFLDAENSVSENLKKAITQAYQNIYTFHEAQKEVFPVIETMSGVRCWRKSLPIEKVGLYIPGGSAPLFSTVLMLGIPARIAGCQEIVLCTPCDAKGKINPAILFTAELIGIKKVFKLGGIQAVAAMTLGTETVPAVYKLFGPGNQYLTAAKQYAQKFKVSIDLPAGPSEVMVVADEYANPTYVAADLLSQAEHGADSQVVLVTTSGNFALTVSQEVQKQLEFLPRKTQAEGAIQNSVILVCKQEDCPEIINFYAPEHLILNTNFNDELLEKVSNAGSVFIGQFTPESAGDYASGTNHTLPTNGFARNYSGVSLDSFIKKITYQEITPEGLKNLGKTIEIMAEAEGLLAHKNAVSIRLKNLK